MLRLEGRMGGVAVDIDTLRMEDLFLCCPFQGMRCVDASCAS